ncbi:putative F-box protein At3g61730 [Wolffia australiana]
MYRTRKRQRALACCKSPRSTFLSSNSSFGCYDEDVWTEIAKYLDGKTLARLGMTNRWFNKLIKEESVWKYACLRDLQVPAVHAIHSSWMKIYMSAFDGKHSYSYRQKEKHIDWMRIGAFYFESPTAVLTEKLVTPKRFLQSYDDPQKAILNHGGCVVKNVKTGIWIVDLQLVRCPVCNLNTCEGTMQTLDARHAELFFQEGYKAGTWDYADIGTHRVTKHHAAATGAIFDLKHIKSRQTDEVLDLKAWVGKANDWQPKARIGHFGVAVNTNLQPNEGISVKYQVMRSGGAADPAVSLRISQQLV